MDSKAITKKDAKDVVNGAAFIEKLVGIIEGRVGRLVGAMSQGDKTWLTTERGVALHKRLASAVAVLQSAQSIIEANLPRPKMPELGGGLRAFLLGGGGGGHDSCGDEDCPVHGQAVKQRKASLS